MDKFSTGEIDFLRKLIKTGVRLDKRNFNDLRQQSVHINDLAFADKSIFIRRGSTEAIFNLSFKSSMNTFMALGVDYSPLVNFKDKDYCIFENNENFCLSVNDQRSDDLKTLKVDFSKPNPVFKKIVDFLKFYNVGVSVEMVVVKNDGNLFDILFEGLRLLFSSISIPDVNNLSNETQNQLDLPVSNTFAIFKDVFIADPTLIEESSADFLIHVFHDNEFKSIFLEGSADFSTLEKIICSYQA